MQGLGRATLYLTLPGAIPGLVRLWYVVLTGACILQFKIRAVCWGEARHNAYGNPGGVSNARLRGGHVMLYTSCAHSSDS